jgi:hypothetical protein
MLKITNAEVNMQQDWITWEEISGTDPKQVSALRRGAGSPYYANKALTGFVVDLFHKITLFIEG